MWGHFGSNPSHNAPHILGKETSKVENKNKNKKLNQYPSTLQVCGVALEAILHMMHPTYSRRI